MVEIKLHDIGEGMTEAEITHFLVQPGDKVEIDQPIVEVSTDKMTAEIPAPQRGTVKKLLVEEGNTVAIGTTVLLLEAEGAMDESAATMEKDIITKERPVQKFRMPSPDRRVKAAPYTRKIARELDVDIEKIEGTGKRGRITVEDVRQFADGELVTPVSASSNETGHESTATVSETETIPFKGRRKQIAAKMTQSLFTIPHCTHFEEIDVTQLIEIRRDLKDSGISVSATAFFLKAVSLALSDFPIFNAKLDEEKELIHLEKQHHIGIATDTEEGLIVPVIRNIEQKSIKTIHDDRKILIKKAQENKLSRNEMSGSTFTISNVGPLGGSTGATPIINYPEVALMSFHKTKKRPAVINENEIAIRSIMNISMVFDHRVTDGATAVTFTNRVQELIEKPYLMLTYLK